MIRWEKCALAAVVLIWTAQAPAAREQAAGPPLAQEVRTFHLDIDAPMDSVLPLFGPLRRAEWTPGWTPVFLHRPGGGNAEGAVFTITGPRGDDTWSLTEFDEKGGHVAYAIVSASRVLEDLKIRVVPTSDARCEASVTQRWSALRPESNGDVRLAADEFAAQGPKWTAALNAAVRKVG